MKRVRIVLLSALTFCTGLPGAGQVPELLQDDQSAANLSSQLSNLLLDAASVAEVERAIAQQDYQSAEKILVEEAKRDPRSKRSAKILVIAGDVFFLDGQYLNAAIAWKKSEVITSLDDRSRFTLAMAYIRLNKREWARPELEKLAAERPQNPRYLYWLARLDYDARNYTSAMDRLKTVIELDPKMARAYDTLGLCYDYLGRFDEAVANFDRAIELNRLQAKPSPWPHVDLANTLIALNRLTDAEKNLLGAIEYDQRLPQAHYQLGRVLEMQGRYQDALDSLKAAVTLAPDYADPHYLLARVYHRLDDEPKSKAEIARYQELKKAAERPAATAAVKP